ncbi:MULTISPECIES: hypothetical protein [Rhodococcus]|uniref:Uncharacterized protein n=1 Tax=Rhodococcus oxybenzonivorans TaxID=1990687 RepID=A0AAE4V3E8_9NOCA|nr:MULTISPECIES: hypothetical protein [Rhodococcus]MDV7245137.1 hypothetical protein [Rhodococcus oxybenzonivorans]MDV7267552.1 hypothetical protein [Rhodococcus oxybenzonivorans]MDV7272581.1 hypothetical protein [Rhodococcus oxybenzonivorans]MDV7336162.1 hypothetical protein [Rhodococcus oxybenzonivorans]MDV8025587.1 hypothetical protein [Rhodococcus sp. IEGM 27]
MTNTDDGERITSVGGSVVCGTRRSPDEATVIVRLLHTEAVPR